MTEDAVVPKSWGRFVHYIKGGRPFGHDGRIRVSYFLDLLSAAHDDTELEILSDLLANLIRKNEDAASYSAVTCPKRGNVLLLKEVGRKLGKKTAFIRDSILFSNWLEGDLRLGERVLILDDIASDGEMLRDAVFNLRKVGVFSNSVYVLVDRSEGDAEKVLEGEELNYRFVHRLSDENLANLKAGGS